MSGLAFSESKSGFPITSEEKPFLPPPLSLSLVCCFLPLSFFWSFVLSCFSPTREMRKCLLLLQCMCTVLHVWVILLSALPFQAKDCLGANCSLLSDNGELDEEEDVEEEVVCVCNEDLCNYSGARREELFNLQVRKRRLEEKEEGR